jgi:hypothetical protein
MSTRIVAVFLVVALLACPVVHAQDQDRTTLWRSYAQALPPHSLVVVQLNNGRSVRGHLVQVTDDRIVVLRKTRVRVPPSTFALADVESIEPQKDSWSPGAKVLMASVGAAGAVMMIVVLAILARND